MRACFAHLKHPLESVKLGDLWPVMHCGFSLTYSRCYHLCPSSQPPASMFLSVDKSSVSRPAGLEKLLTVDCLFGFVNVSGSEKRMNTEVVRAPGGHRIPPLVGHRDVILCTYELTCNPVTFDPTGTSTQQKLNPNLTCWIVLVRLPQATNNFHTIMSEPSERGRKMQHWKRGEKEKGKPELNHSDLFYTF